MLRFLAIFLFPICIFGQASQLDYSVGMNRLDFFTGVKYKHKIDSFYVLPSFEIGVNRTIFQSRFFPRLGVQVYYPFSINSKIKLDPSISYNYSTLKVNRNSSHFHQWNELQLGSRLEIGQQFKFINELFIGLLNERYFNQIKQSKSGVNTLGFSATIGIGYAL